MQYYTLNVYSGTGCSGDAVRTQTGSSTSLTLSAALPADDADYSWTITPTDNLDNVGTTSACDDFSVNTAVPSLSDATITDTTLASTSYTTTGNPVSVSATITQTTDAFITLDASALTGSGAHSSIQCSAPPTGIACSYAGNIATYEFDAGFAGSIESGVRQAEFTATNTSGGGTGTILASITVDDIAPTANAPFTEPTSATVWGGTTQTITWDTQDVSDNIAVDSVELAYSTGAHTDWTIIGTGANNGSRSWDVSALESGTDYQIRMIVRDGVGNATTALSDEFAIDKTAPTVGSDTLTAPTANSVLQ